MHKVYIEAVSTDAEHLVVTKNITDIHQELLAKESTVQLAMSAVLAKAGKVLIGEEKLESLEPDSPEAKLEAVNAEIAEEMGEKEYTQRIHHCDHEDPSEARQGCRIEEI